MSKPFISIITITYNDPGLSRTIKSTINQKTNLAFEHIIIEGCKTSTTKKIVEKYQKEATFPVTYLCEKDTGRYNAMNKGIRIAKGDYLLFLNGGDHFCNNQSLDSFRNKTKKYDIVYGNIYINNQNELHLHTPPDTLNFKYFLRSALPHQATLIKSSLFVKFGLYDETLQISSDHNFFLLTIVKHHCTYFHLDKPISVYYFNGISSDPNKAIQNTKEKNNALDRYFSDFSSKSISHQPYDSSFYTPILFLLFNLPDTTQKVFDQLKKIRPKYLYIAADGARSDRPDERQLCNKTRAIINQIDWNCQLKTLFRNVNFGCGSSISKAITWFFDNVSEGIILEDDCIPDLSFFHYCQSMLVKYRHDTRICHINGTSFVNIPDRKTSYYFSRYFHVWGWATWKRAWDNYDFTMLSYPEFLQSHGIENLFTDKNIQAFWLNSFNQVYENKLDTWDYQWAYTNFINNSLSIYPLTNLVTNIGFDNRATHTTNENDTNANRSTSQITKIVHPNFIIPEQFADNLIYLNHLKVIKPDKKNINSPPPARFWSSGLGYIKTIFTELNDPISHKKRRFKLLAVFLIWPYIIYTFIRYNLRYPSFWFDEAGQFWISQGLNHFSPIFSHSKDIVSVIKNNISFNLDPGGFSVLLHFWSLISTNHTFLRLLPLTFFVTSMLVVSKLASKFNPNNISNYFFGLILLTSPLFCQYSFELRAYSMELLCTITSAYLVYQSARILNSKKWALLSGTTLSLLISSRYSAIIPVLSLSLFLVLRTIRNFSNNKQSIINLILFSLPIINAFLAIYLITYRFQNPHGLSPGYVSNLTLNSFRSVVSLFNQNSLPVVLPVMVFVVFSITFVKRNFDIYKQKYGPFAFFIFSVTAFFTTLSVFEKYPFDFVHKWNISLQSLFVISWIPSFSIILDLLGKKLNLSRVISFFLAVVLIIIGYNSSNNFHIPISDSIFINYQNYNISSESKVLTNVGAYPTIKYLFEYGPFKNQKFSIYPKIDTFNHDIYTLPNSVSDFNNLNSYDYIFISFFDPNTSNFYSYLSKNHNWKDMTVRGPSKLFINTQRVNILQ